MHDALAQTGKWLKSVVRGYFNYCAVPGNTDSLCLFRTRVTRLWRQVLTRRSQRHNLNWARMQLEVRRSRGPRVLHPYPEVRFDAIQSKIGASGGNAARGDLCGGCRATDIPTATGTIGFRPRCHPSYKASGSCLGGALSR
jgi:RNA-directed DNA polymerase